ncbi:MAG: hypothetical protein ACLSUV_08060 [Bacilli bacterium]
MYKITQEMENEIQEMDKKNFKQWDYLKKAIPRIIHWSKKNNCRIYRIHCIPHSGISVDICIFYKTDKELIIYKESNIIDLTKEAVMNILTEIGYVEEFNDNVIFTFDSDENVQKNYQGNYGLRLHGD